MKTLALCNIDTTGNTLHFEGRVGFETRSRHRVLCHSSVTTPLTHNYTHIQFPSSYRSSLQPPKKVTHLDSVTERTALFVPTKHEQFLCTLNEKFVASQIKTDLTYRQHPKVHHHSGWKPYIYLHHQIPYDHHHISRTY
jgi:hypothetical protein